MKCKKTRIFMIIDLIKLMFPSKILKKNYSLKFVEIIELKSGKIQITL